MHNCIGGNVDDLSDDKDIFTATAIISSLV